MIKREPYPPPRKTKGTTRINESTTKEHPPYNGQHTKPPSGVYVKFTGQIFALDTVGVWVRFLPTPDKLVKLYCCSN